MRDLTALSRDQLEHALHAIFDAYEDPDVDPCDTVSAIFLAAQALGVPLRDPEDMDPGA